MWPFRPREPATDAVGDICRLLVERPWEWVVGKTTGRNVYPHLRHLSGVFLVYNVTTVWLGVGEDAPSMPVLSRDCERLLGAIRGNAAARISRPKCDYDSVVAAMCLAALAGDRTAARQLADKLMELEGGTANE